jgi:hypothetical protein
MKHKQLSIEEKAAARQLVKDKTRPLRIRFFAESSLKILFWLGVVALVGYGGFYLWSLVYVKSNADRIEQKIQNRIMEIQRDSYPDQ